MVQNIIGTLYRGIGAYLLLLLLARASGRKMISQMTYFDFALGVTVGSLTANLALGPKSTVESAVTALVTLTILTIATGYMHIKSYGFRKLINSEPVVVIDKGHIVNENLRKTRYTIDELMMKLRSKNIFNIADVEFAVIEIDGTVSVLPKSSKQPLTPSDINLNTDYMGLTADIIIDGLIMNENLNTLGKDRRWLQQQLSANGVKDAREVFYAGLDTSGKLYVSLKNSNREKEGQHTIE